MNPVIRHIIPLLIYILFAIAAGLIVAYGVPAKAQPSLKDAPIQRLALAPEAQVPLPLPKPEGDRNAAFGYNSTDEELPDAPLPNDKRRIMLLTCASYYSITTTILAPIAQDEAKAYRERGIAALRRADKLRSRGSASADWVKEQDDVFLSVFEQYMSGGDQDALGLYDRYNEVCNNAVRPLLLRQEE